MVAAPGALTTAENVIAQRLTIAGYDVVFADDTTVTAADATGKSFVLVAQSTTAARAGTVLRGLTVPIWVAKPSLFPTFGLTGSVENVDFGFKASPATVTIAGPRAPDGRRSQRLGRAPERQEPVLGQAHRVGHHDRQGRHRRHHLRGRAR